MSKIGIAGAQSVGKTTLLNALRSESVFESYNICTEVTRWVRNLGIDINEQGSDNSQILIMMKHIYNIFMFDNMLTDRTALDGMVYTSWLHSKGKVSDQTLADSKRIYNKIISEYDFIFFIEPEFDIEDDGVRSTNIIFRDEINEIFKTTINNDNLLVYNLTGSVKDRIETVLTIIKD